MSQLSPDQLRSRYQFDFQVIQRMTGTAWSAHAYRSASDLEHTSNEIADSGDANEATKYHVVFHVPTLIGPGKMADTTGINVDLAVGNYPYSEPNTWVTSDIPYSPHFKENAPICLGEMWREAKGRMLLGQLFNHIGRLLNWDEVMRGGGYRGWNGAAIDYHRAHYGNKPLNPSLVYPALPVDLTHGVELVDETLFALEHRSVSELFVPANVSNGRKSDLFESA